MRGMVGLRSILGFAVLPLVLASFVTACSASNADGDEGADDGAALTDAPLSYVGKNVMQTLMNQQELKALQGRTWDVSRGNVLENGWLLPTFGSEWWGDKITTLPMDTSCADGE